MVSCQLVEKLSPSVGKLIEIVFFKNWTGQGLRLHATHDYGAIILLTFMSSFDIIFRKPCVDRRTTLIYTRTFALVQDGKFSFDS